MTIETPAQLAREWAALLPPNFARRLAAALASGGPGDLRKLKSQATGPQTRAAVTIALDAAARGAGPYLGGLLEGRLDAAVDGPIITPVWTGPAPTSTGYRLTLAVIADLIATAEHELILVSYATYPSLEIKQALEAAAMRGVEITLLLERKADNPHFKGVAEPFPGLLARRLCWPASERPSDASMHAKILVVDRRVALVGSANLTGSALERNLECGILVQGGGVPGDLARHLLATAALREP